MKSILLLLCALLLALTTFAQTKITGTVSDDIGLLPLTNITIKNSSKGTFSNIDGRFSIEAKSTDTLQFSYLGYKTTEVVVGKQTNIDFVFESFEELDEVVLNAYSSRIHCISILCCDGIRCELEGKAIIDENFERKNDIKLYPNPSKDGIFNISLLEDISEVNIIVADLTGRVILNRKEHKLKSSFFIDLSNQPSGIYIINVSCNGSHIATKKAIRL